MLKKLLEDFGPLDKANTPMPTDVEMTAQSTETNDLLDVLTKLVKDAKESIDGIHKAMSDSGQSKEKFEAARKTVADIKDKWQLKLYGM